MLKISAEQQSSLTDISGDILKNVGKYMYFLRRTTLAASDIFTKTNLLGLYFQGNHRKARIQSVCGQCQESN